MKHLKLFLVLTVILVAMPFALADLTDGLVSYWKFDETSGTVLDDAHGTDDLTVDSSVTGGDGIINNGGIFTQATQYHDTSYTSFDTETDSFTYSVWVEYTDTPTNWGGPIFVEGGSTQILGIIYRNNQITAVAGGGLVYGETGINPSLDTWYHLVVTYSDKKITIFVDGEEKADATFTGSHWTSEKFTIGNMDGNLDEIGIWSRVLTSTEIADLYNEGDGLSYDSFTGEGVSFSLPVISSGNTYEDYFKGTITIRTTYSEDADGLYACEYSINNGATYAVADIDTVNKYCYKEITPNDDVQVKFRGKEAEAHDWTESTAKTFTYDNTPPTTSSSVTSGTLGLESWYRTNVEITLNPSDDGSGVDATTYCTDTDNTCSPTTSYTTPVTITDEGTNYIRYTSTDNLGNEETVQSLEVKIDKTAPTTSGSVTSGNAMQGGEHDGVYYTDVVYTLSEADALSGVETTYYCTDSTNTCNPTTTYTSEITLNTDGNHYVRYYSEDTAGNEQTVQSSGLIEIDSSLTPNFRIFVNDSYTKEALNSFCVEIYENVVPPDEFGTGEVVYPTETGCTVTGSYTSDILYTSGWFGVRIYDIESNTYFNSSDHYLTYNLVNAEQPYTYLADESKVNITVKELISNNVLNDYRIVFNYSFEGDSFIFVPAGEQEDETWTHRNLIEPIEYVNDIIYNLSFEARCDSGQSLERYLIFDYRDNTSITTEAETSCTGNWVKSDFENPNPHKPVSNITVVLIPSASSNHQLRNSEIDGARSISSNDMPYGISAGTHEFDIILNEYFAKTFSFETFNVQTTQEQIILHNSELLVDAEFIIDSTPISNFTVHVTAQNTIYTANYNTTNGTINIPLLQGYEYLIEVDAPGYSNQFNNNYTYTPNNMSSTHTFQLYTENSILINVYREQDNTLIDNQTVNIFFGGDPYESENSTSNGVFYIDDLIDGIYNIKVGSDGFTERNYFVTVQNRSAQLLNTYLATNTSQVTFTSLDIDSDNIISGASITMYRSINNTWSSVESRSTDITGRAVFNYVPDKNYRFISSKEGYEDKVFNLDPIIFDFYNIRLRRDVSLNFELDYTNVFISYDPKKFFNDNTTEFTFYIQSPSGTLTNYFLNVSYPGGEQVSNGSNSIGELFYLEIPVSGATITDRVVIKYSYTTVLGQDRSFTRSYAIDRPPSEFSWLNRQSQTYGLGVLETSFISIIFTLSLAGVAGIVAGALPGLILGFMAIGFFTILGFIPWWASAVSLFVGFVLIVGRSD